MKLKSSIYIFLFVCLHLRVAVAQHYNFRVYSLDEGLPQSEIYDILQDKRGAIWLATNGGGACRFDGRNFTIFNQQNGLTNNNVKKLFEDSKGNIWFVTERGANKYDGQKLSTYAEKEGFTSGNKFQIFENDKGIVWIYVEKEYGISKLLYYQNNQFIDFSAQYLQLIKNNNINGILLTSGNKLLINTSNNLYEYDGNKLNISSIQDIPEIKYKKAKPLLEDSQQRLWMILSDTWSVLQLAYLKDGKITYITLPQNINLKNLITLYEDKYKNIWLSVDGFGVLKYDFKDFQLFTKANGMPNDYILKIFQDKESNIWFGSSGSGLIKYVGETFVNFTQKDGLDSDFIWSIFQDSHNNFWFGTSGGGSTGGLCKYDGKVITKAIIKGLNSLKRVKEIYELPNGNLLLGTYEGLWEYSGGYFQNVNGRYGIPTGSQITSICAIDNSHIWFGTLGNGAIYYSPDSIARFNSQNKNLISNLVTDVLKDSKGNIWFCTNYGVSKWDGKEMTNYARIQGMISDYVTQIDEDKNGNLWFASFGGIIKFDGKVFTNYTIADGLVSTSIYSIKVDKKNNVWAGTQNGITRIFLEDNGDIKKIKNYGVNEGFIGIENNSNAIFEDNQGKLWFGTVKGAIRFAPDQENLNLEPPITNITNVRLFFKEVNWTSETYKEFTQGILPWNKLPQKLTLPHYLNHIAFDFEGLQYQVPEGTRYKWMLETIDKDWTPVSSKTETVYPNLPPGKYVFKVMSSNNDGIWTAHPATFKFEILPPVWDTIWFKVAAFGIVFLFIFFAIRWRLLSIERQKKDLEKAVTQAKAELLVQNQELKRQQDEIEQQRANLEALNTTKDKFFSILAHDIKGPLNSLTAFLDIMSKHIDEMSKDDIQFMSASLNKSVKNLYSLLENVLSWSRSQMGVLEYQFDMVNLREIVNNNIQLLDVSAKNKGIDLISEVNNQTEAYIDVNSINTVIRNLISNAIKFTSVDGKVTIHTTEKDDLIHVSISDTGLGMSKEIQERIFRLDTRISTKGTANETGTGLGLILCKEFVEKNGGKIWVQSEEGKGTTFTFTLPTNGKYQNNEENTEKPDS